MLDCWKQLRLPSQCPPQHSVTKALWVDIFQRWGNLWKLPRYTRRGLLKTRAIIDLISVVCDLSKKLERLVPHSLYTYLISHNMLHDGQSGFWDSTEPILVHKWVSAIEKGLVNGVVLLDLLEAFDIVNYTILLDKLTIYRYSQQLVRWVSSYLSVRKQFVLFKSKQSVQSEITGVP